jgi:hypothetical protein
VLWRSPLPFHRGVDNCRCAPPTIAGKFNDGSARCSVITPSVQAQMLDGACLPPAQASLEMAPQDVATAGTPSIQAQMLVGACLPLSLASMITALLGVAATGIPPPSRRTLAVACSFPRHGWVKGSTGKGYV